MEIENSTKRSGNFYDIVRVMATIFVVIGHSVYSSWQGDSGNILLDISNASNCYYWLAGKIGKIVGWIYGFHMPLFFVLSGALYKYSRNIDTLDNLLKSKFHRLIIPYYITGILYMFPIKFVSGFYTKENFFGALQGFLFGGNAAHLWFLITLFWCFFLFYFIEKFVLRKSIWGGAILICIIYNLYINNILNFSFINCIPRFSSALNYIPYFFGGYFVEEIRRNHFFKRNSINLLAILCAVLSIFQFKYNMFNNATLIALIGVALIYSLSLFLGSFDLFWKLKWFKVLLRNSMYIYLFHEPLNFVMLRLANDTKMIETNIGAIVFFLGRTIFSILFSITLGEVIIRLKKIKKYKLDLGS